MDAEIMGVNIVKEPRWILIIVDAYVSVDGFCVCYSLELATSSLHNSERDVTYTPEMQDGSCAYNFLHFIEIAMRFVHVYLGV